MDNDFKKWSDIKYKEAIQQYSPSRRIEFSFIPHLLPIRMAYRRLESKVSSPISSVCWVIYL